jgi:flagellar hook-associated protein 2
MSVGISFGSPTSGDGFNVSATVSEIVANLQNVETPWKTQLATLESQDTVISSLGTLLSTLSTDMTSLTEAKGALSMKEGSSSDSSVLELTAASTSAVAGTHTVLVSALAATSSGRLLSKLAPAARLRPLRWIPPTTRSRG